MNSIRTLLGVPPADGELVGRDSELAHIDVLFERIGARGGSLLIRGEPGIGKSALLGEAASRAELGGVLRSSDPSDA
jgi:MoxR-like ATPase